VNITCTAAGDEFPANFTIRIAATSGTPPCESTATLETTITAECCISGKAVTFGKSKSSSAKCYNNPKAPCDHLGYVNKFMAKDTSPVFYPLIFNQGTDCKGGGQIGRVSLQCVSNGKGEGSTVTIGPLDRRVVGVSEPVFYLGCKPPGGKGPDADKKNTTKPDKDDESDKVYKSDKSGKEGKDQKGGKDPSSDELCTKPNFGAPSTTCDPTSKDTSCGGRLPALLSEPQTFELGCPCGSVYWAVQETSEGFVVDRVDGVCPIAPPPSNDKDPKDPKPKDPKDPKPKPEKDPKDPKPKDPKDPKPKPEKDPKDPKPKDPTNPNPKPDKDPKQPKPRPTRDPKDPTEPKPEPSREPRPMREPKDVKEPSSPSQVQERAASAEPQALPAEEPVTAAPEVQAARPLLGRWVRAMFDALRG
jgi:hypothetical protein